KTLELIKQQYPGTALEHYADMRAAAIWEYGRGDPHKALAAYQATLARHKDHLYAPYVHRQMQRLHGVIEQQLIQDALEGLAKKDQEQEQEAELEAGWPMDDVSRFQVEITDAPADEAPARPSKPIKAATDAPAPEPVTAAPATSDETISKTDTQPH